MKLFKLSIVCLTILYPFNATNADCFPVSNTVLSLCDDCKVLIFGEHHKESEGHRIFADIVKEAIKQNSSIMVGLEIDNDRQEDLDMALAGTRSPESIAFHTVDGPSYQSLIKNLGNLRGKYPAKIDVRAIDIPSSDGRSRDAGMTSNIMDALASEKYDKILILVGSLHSLKKVRWVDYVPDKTPKLGEMLSIAGIRVTSVMHEAGPACNGKKYPKLYTMAEQEGREAARFLVSKINVKENMTIDGTLDGAVLWESRNSR